MQQRQRILDLRRIGIIRSVRCQSSCGACYTKDHLGDFFLPNRIHLE